MKLRNMLLVVARNRRAPRGARGLKPLQEHNHHAGRWSRPARGAWIETRQSPQIRVTESVAPRAGRVD